MRQLFALVIGLGLVPTLCAVLMVGCSSRRPEADLAREIMMVAEVYVSTKGTCPTGRDLFPAYTPYDVPGNGWVIMCGEGYVAVVQPGSEADWREWPTVVARSRRVPTPQAEAR